MTLRFLCFTLLTFGASGAPKPDNIPVSVWVREDLFAGYLDADMRTFERGERKLAELLAQNPKSRDARAWKLSADFFRAILLHEAKDHKAFELAYSQVTKNFENLRQEAPTNIGVLAVHGAMITTLGHRLPVELQAEANQRAGEAYSQLEQLQKAYFDKMPVHHRGEVLAGLAQTAARSGQSEVARKYLRRIVESLPSTSYEAFAQTMLNQPNAMKTTRIVCSSCHEPNRLAMHYKGEQ